MKSIQTRLLSILLAVCLLTGLMPSAFASGEVTFTVENIKYHITDTENQYVEVVHTAYTGEPFYNPQASTYSGEIAIPASVTNNDTSYTVKGLGYAAFIDANITSITLPEGLEYIESAALANTKITSVIIPPTVTRMGGATPVFAGTDKANTTLASITFAPDSQITEISDRTFENCAGITALSLPASITAIGQDAFKGCSALTTLEIPAGVTEGVAAALHGYANAKSVTFADGSPYNIEGGVLYNGTTLEGPIDDTVSTVAVKAGTTAIADGAFYVRKAADSTLKEITLPDSVITIGESAFQNTPITTISLPGVTTIGADAFANCTGLTEVQWPDSMESLGSGAFAGCVALKKVEIPQGVTEIPDYAFSGCLSLESITLPEGITTIGQSAFELLDEDLEPGKNPTLTYINIPSTVTSLGAYFLGGLQAGGATALVFQCKTMPALAVDTTDSGGDAFSDFADFGAPTIYYPSVAKDVYTGEGTPLESFTDVDGAYGLTMNDRSVKAAATGATANTLTFTADVPTGAMLRVESSNPAVATAEVGEDGKTITVTSVAQGEAKIAATITLTDSNFVLLEKTSTVTVLGADREPAIVVPAAPEAKKDLPETATEDEKTLANNVETALKPAGGSAGLTVEEEKLSAAANTVVTQNTVTVEAGVTKLDDVGIDVSGATVSIVVQPYMEVVIKDVDITEATTTLTLEITPMYQTVATTADLNKTNPDEIVVKKDSDTNNPNAAIVNRGKLTVTEPVEIRVPLPEGFATGEQLFVTHIKSNDRSYVYTGTVADNILTFTNPHGFSTFTMSTSNPTVAKIGDIGYTSLQDALDEAANGSTVDVLQDGLRGNITQTKTITLRNTTDGPVSVTINGTVYSLEAKETQAVSYTRPSGGGGSATYAVSVDSAKNGAVSASPQNASKGDTVTLTVTPDKGYELSELTVTDKNGDVVQLTDKGNGKYTFTMPASKVSVKAGFVKTSVVDGLPFTDVSESDWYYDAVEYIYGNGMMNGTGATTFAPNIATTRGMIVTILYRLEGAPAVSGANPFDDVAAGAYYESAITWAAANGIVGGYGDGRFGPNDSITREQMVTMLYRYAQMKGMDVSVGENTNILSYNDAFDVAEWAVPAFQWACGEGIVSGTSATTLAPQGSATRAQVATILMRFCEKLIK